MRLFAVLVTLIPLLAAAPVSAAFDPNRLVTSVDYAARSFTCQAKPGDPSYTYKATQSTRIRIHGQRPRLSHIRDKGDFALVKVGERVTVQFHLHGHERIAERIVIHPPAR